MGNLMRYTLKDYERDVEAAAKAFLENALLVYEDGGTDEQIADALKTPAARRSAHIAAAGKRLRASVALDLLHELAGDYDITTTLAVHITEQLLGRAIERKTLLAEFGTTGRTAADKSLDHQKLDEIANSPAFEEAQRSLASYLESAACLRKMILMVYRDKLREQAPGPG